MGNRKSLTPYPLSFFIALRCSAFQGFGPHKPVDRLSCDFRTPKGAAHGPAVVCGGRSPLNCGVLACNRGFTVRYSYFGIEISPFFWLKNRLNKADKPCIPGFARLNAAMGLHYSACSCAGSVGWDGFIRYVPPISNTSMPVTPGVEISFAMSFSMYCRLTPVRPRGVVYILA